MSSKIQALDEIGEGKVYKKPTTEVHALTAESLEYLTSARKLSKETIEAYRLGSTAKGSIILPHYDENDNLQLIKFRHATGGMLDLNGKEIKTFIEKDGRPVLFGSHLCEDPNSALIICAGEYDAMAVYEAGINNAVSMPFGDLGFGFIQQQWDFLEGFREIILFSDQDHFKTAEAEERFIKKQNELIDRLGRHRVRLIELEHRLGTKDANELLVKHGSDAVEKAVANAQLCPIKSVVSLADYEDIDVKEGRSTGYNFLDRNTGGLGDGELVVISGDNGAGKTTFVLNLMAKSIDLKCPVLMWSGEQRPGRLRYWFHRIAAGRSNLREIIKPDLGYSTWFPHDACLPYIKHWYREYFYIFNDFNPTAEEFFEICEIAIRRYGIKTLVIDNLMAFTGGMGDGYYQAQGDFAQSCKMFADRWAITVVLIAHNKKAASSKGTELYIPSKGDIEGSQKITNWADMVIQMVRVPQEFRFGNYEGCDGAINLCKSRETGIMGTIGTLVDAASNRITIATQYNSHHFEWESDYQNRSSLQLEGI